MFNISLSTTEGFDNTIACTNNGTSQQVDRSGVYWQVNTEFTVLKQSHHMITPQKRSSVEQPHPSPTLPPSDVNASIHL